MAAYRRYDSRHLQADCEERGSAPEPYAAFSLLESFQTRVGISRVGIANP